MIASDEARALLQEWELIRVEFDGLRQQLAALDERQRNDKGSLSRMVGAMDEQAYSNRKYFEAAIAELRHNQEADRVAGSLQDQKLSRVEALLQPIRFWIILVAAFGALFFTVTIILLVVIALQR